MRFCQKHIILPTHARCTRGACTAVLSSPHLPHGELIRKSSNQSNLTRGEEIGLRHDMGRGLSPPELPKAAGAVDCRHGVCCGAVRCCEHTDCISFLLPFVEAEADRGVTIEQPVTLGMRAQTQEF